MGLPPRLELSLLHQTLVGSFHPILWPSGNQSLLGSREPTLLCNRVESLIDFSCDLHNVHGLLQKVGPCNDASAYNPLSEVVDALDDFSCDGPGIRWNCCWSITTRFARP